MRSRHKSVLLPLIFAAATMNQDVFGVPKRYKTNTQLPKIKPTVPPQLHKFIVKGVEIEATSKKDAIKRYNHQYGKKKK